MTPEQFDALARTGARIRLAAIDAEIDRIVSGWPDLSPQRSAVPEKRGPGRPRGSVKVIDDSTPLR